MREISLDVNPQELPTETVLIYGHTGTGKTTWSASFPRPLFLADETEGGWESLKGLGPDQLFEPDIKPMVWGIREISDMATAIEKVGPYIQSGRVKTIVISSITFYANSYLANMQRLQPSIDMRQLYGHLGTHLRDLRTRLHGLGVNVIWEALADDPDSGGDGKAAVPGRPQIAGKAATQFAAGAMYLFRSTMEDRREGGKIVERVHKLQTAMGGGYLARARIGAASKQLPDPMTGGYCGFLRARGLDPDVLRKALPPIAKPAVRPTAQTAPAVATTPAARPQAQPQRASPTSSPKAATPSAATPITTTTTTKK